MKPAAALRCPTRALTRFAVLLCPLERSRPPKSSSQVPTPAFPRAVITHPAAAHLKQHWAAGHGAPHIIGGSEDHTAVVARAGDEEVNVVNMAPDADRHQYAFPGLGDVQEAACGQRGLWRLAGKRPRGRAGRETAGRDGRCQVDVACACQRQWRDLDDPQGWCRWQQRLGRGRAVTVDARLPAGRVHMRRVPLLRSAFAGEGSCLLGRCLPGHARCTLHARSQYVARARMLTRWAHTHASL